MGFHHPPGKNITYCFSAIVLLTPSIHGCERRPIQPCGRRPILFLFCAHFPLTVQINDHRSFILHSPHKNTTQREVKRVNRGIFLPTDDLPGKLVSVSFLFLTRKKERGFSEEGEREEVALPGYWPHVFPHCASLASGGLVHLCVCVSSLADGLQGKELLPALCVVASLPQTHNISQTPTHIYNHKGSVWSRDTCWDTHSTHSGKLLASCCSGLGGMANSSGRTVSLITFKGKASLQIPLVFSYAQTHNRTQSPLLSPTIMSSAEPQFLFYWRLSGVCWKNDGKLLPFRRLHNIDTMCVSDMPTYLQPSPLYVFRCHIFIWFSDQWSNMLMQIEKMYRYHSLYRHSKMIWTIALKVGIENILAQTAHYQANFDLIM